MRRLPALVALSCASLMMGACTTDPTPSGPDTQATPAGATAGSGNPTTGDGAASSISDPPGPRPGPGALAARWTGEIADGDSLMLEVNGAAVEVRLRAVNAPEHDECWSTEALAITRSFLSRGDLTVEIGDVDQYGRTLAYLWQADLLINLELLERGAAIALTVDHPHLDAFLEAEERAHSARVGLWAGDACGPDDRTALSIESIVADPPGPDEENLSGETVTIINRGGTLDIGGWTLRDESSVHRFVFPPATVLGSGETVVVHTGCGLDGAGHLFWCADGPVWSNGGDMGLLLDLDGTVVARHRYR